MQAICAKRPDILVGPWLGGRSVTYALRSVTALEHPLNPESRILNPAVNQGVSPRRAAGAVNRDATLVCAAPSIQPGMKKSARTAIAEAMTANRAGPGNDTPA